MVCYKWILCAMRASACWKRKPIMFHLRLLFLMGLHYTILCAVVNCFVTTTLFNFFAGVVPVIWMIFVIVWVPFVRRERERERDHRVKKDVAISKSTSPTCSFMQSMESDYRPLMVNGQHCWRRTLYFHYKAHGHFACECLNRSAPYGANMDFNRWHSMQSRNRHGSENDKQRASIGLNSMIRQNLRDFDLYSMIKRNLRGFVNDIIWDEVWWTIYQLWFWC